ncbi:breast cancer susceptibility1, ARABIDOPSIS THALIANA BREAST CANCER SUSCEPTIBILITY1 [Hibiscus trionum]|uniref:Breast cancer susceptibility1, ARABIDOPSIS THALIANA BREAST CANCER SUSCEPTIBILITY1 n=1 Tax=Hibiscus trionum TaxID=183268 RepID=A0A9W7M4U2_HIBTR|nr:breast cancer susceptibility1, ARABIDOPSIS THALIANA BREAST CANCER SUSCEPTIBILITY1 [Hibiscus trionum]
MGDPSHLEKMGRELKCPICLSLLDSAVSLTCNHVFCNVCILKSMKSGSDCPVCKVPYRRREVRPAPHMDSLVNIYKSMEVASGFSIFVTQNPPLDCSERADNQGENQRRGSSVAKSTESSGSIPVKPSFPANKRVQVPQYPLSETPMRSAKNGNGLVEITKDESKRSSDTPKETYNLRENGEQTLAPFFWLREEDVERPSQLTDGDQCVYSTPHELPSFSDMKDSDDEGFSSEEEMRGNPDHVNLFDSEMFEWTQRPCSPELLPSPVKMQVEDTEEPALQGANTIEPFNNGTCMITRHNTSDEMLPNITSSKTKHVSHKIGSRISGKLGSKQRKSAQKKMIDRTSSHISGDHDNLGKGSEDFNKKQAPDCSRSSSYLARTRKKCNVAGLDHHENADTPKQDDTQLPAVVGKGKRGDGSCGKIPAQCQKKSSLKSKKQKPCTADIPEEVSTVQSLADENMIQQKSLLSIPLVHDSGAKQVRKRSIKRTREVKSATSLKSEKTPNCKKKMKVSFSGDTKGGLAEDHQQQQGISNVSHERPIEKAHGSPIGIAFGSTVKKLPLANGGALRKCETIAKKTQCAFCLSTEDSEATGEMVHYYEGRPVPQDYNGGSKVIHSHKNCTEWAPNVYFENEKAINLEAELSRSRKIKCSCCGLKGAALGCYEKCCRKSFHVPCAKLVSQCRWDTDNFVMLCPLHPYSKLPNEKPESQGSRKRSVLRGHFPIHHSEIPTNEDVCVQKKWSPCESHNKLVLCCSALTVEEKEIISEFEKLAGVTVLKRWDSNVTHIVASTDENGACKRTLKFLMGVSEGKWILNINWVKACIKAMKPVDELPYEISIDVHGIRDGPRLGRLRLQNEQPKLFNECKFYIMGDFEPSYKGYLQDVVIAAGGIILHRKPISGGPGALLSGCHISSTFIIYSVELLDKCDPKKRHMVLSHRQSDAEALASSTGAKAVSNSWVLNSISACKMQSLGL